MEKSLSELVKSSCDPVDPDLFVWCYGIYEAAASLSMPVENPAAKPLFADGDKTYSFKDIPMNRGMLAVMKELNDRGLSEEQKMAFGLRLMNSGDIFKYRAELQNFFKDGDEPGVVLISEAIVKACATARMITTEKHVGYDITDVARIAQELTDADEECLP